MNARLAPRAWLAALALCGCGEATEVELRLYPCALPGGAPTSVRVEIQSYGAGGDAVGGVLDKSFSIADPAVFSDGYATVGFVPPAGTVTADFTVTWTEEGAEAVATYTAIAVPKPGEAIALGADDCEGGTDTTGDPTTGDPTTTGTGSGSTSTGTGTSTTEASSSSGTGTTEMSTSTSTGETGSSGSSGSTGDPMEGGPCGMDGAVYCDGGPGELGTLLICEGGTWGLHNLSEACTVENVCPPELGLAMPVLAGCFGTEVWTCGCVEADMQAKLCAPDGVSKCGDVLPDGHKIELCVTEGADLVHYVGKCIQCVEDVPGQPYCVGE